MIYTKIAIAQIQVESGAFVKNMEKVRSFISEASCIGSEIVIFPECSDIGWLSDLNWQEAHRRFLENIYSLKRLSKLKSIYTCIGLTDGEDNKLYNTSVLFSPEGKLLLSHRKINLLDFERKVYSQGSSLSVVSVPVERTSILICADNFPQSLSLGRSVGQMGARLLLSPCSWAIEPGQSSDPDEQMWVTSFKTLAKEFGMTTIAVSNVGILENQPWKGYQCIGNSVIVGRNGMIIHRCSFGDASEEMAVVDVPYLR